MGLLFQPRWSRQSFTAADRASAAEEPSDRGGCSLAALEAVLLGDASRFADLFTRGRRGPQPAPGGRVAGIDAARRWVRPRTRLSDVEITVLAVDAVGDKVIGEWRLDATFTRPVLYDDRLLIEPTGGRGAAVGGVRRRVPRVSDPGVPPLLRRQRAARRRARHPGARAAGRSTTDSSLAVRRRQLGPGRGVEQAGRGRGLDGAAARRRAELAVDRDRLGLHGVPRDVEAIGDLGHREVRREQLQHAQLGRRQRRRPEPLRSVPRRGRAPAERRRAAPRRATAPGVGGEDRVRLVEQPRGLDVGAADVARRGPARRGPGG